MVNILTVFIVWLAITITFSVIIWKEKNKNDSLYKISVAFIMVIWLCMTAFEFLIEKTLYQLNF